MAFDYKTKYPAVGQFDRNSCWAACLDWWLKVMALGFSKRKWLNQSELIVKFNSLCDPDTGGMPPANFRKVCENAEIRMTLKFIAPSLFKSGFTSLDPPVLVAFNYPLLGGTHMNVLFNRDGDNVQAMEPFHPYPGQDGKRTGTFVTRPVSFYSGSTEIGVGYLPPGDKAAE